MNYQISKQRYIQMEMRRDKKLVSEGKRNIISEASSFGKIVTECSKLKIKALSMDRKYECHVSDIPLMNRYRSIFFLKFDFENSMNALGR